MKKWDTVIKIICSADRGLITLKHTCILYFKGVEWFLILNTFLCCMPCLCTSPCEPIHSWQSWDSVFFHCARCSPQTLNIWSQVCRACWDPANQNISTLPLNNQQPVRTYTLSNTYLAAIQEGLVSPSQYPSHHWYPPHTSTLSQGERQWQVWFSVRHKVTNIK